MTLDESREITRTLEDNCRHGGYLLACVRTLAAEYPTLSWDSLRSKLVVMAYYGGHALPTIERNFNAVR